MTLVETIEFIRNSSYAHELFKRSWTVQTGLTCKKCLRNPTLLASRISNLRMVYSLRKALLHHNVPSLQSHYMTLTLL